MNNLAVIVALVSSGIVFFQSFSHSQEIKVCETNLNTVQREYQTFKQGVLSAN